MLKSNGVLNKSLHVLMYFYCFCLTWSGKCQNNPPLIIPSQQKKECSKRTYVMLKKSDITLWSVCICKQTVCILKDFYLCIQRGKYLTVLIVMLSVKQRWSVLWLSPLSWYIQRGWYILYSFIFSTWVAAAFTEHKILSLLQPIYANEVNVTKFLFACPMDKWKRLPWWKQERKTSKLSGMS